MQLPISVEKRRALNTLMDAGILFEEVAGY
jgi:hypothetical protein